MLSQPLASTEEDELQPFAVLDCVCLNYVPHLCGDRLNDGSQCPGECYHPKKMAHSDPRCWYSVCSINCNHSWYSCCCCARAFKNWEQYKRHISRRHAPSSSRQKNNNDNENSGDGLLGSISGDGAPNAPGVASTTAGLASIEDDSSIGCPLGGDELEEDKCARPQARPPQAAKRPRLMVLPMEEMPNFQTHASTVYFDRDQNGDGPASLVARALTSAEENYKYLRKSDVELGMVLTDFCSRLTRPQRALFAAFLARYSCHLHADWQKKAMASSSTTTSIDIPTDVAGLRRTIYEGVNSIAKNLPHPPPEWIEDHAYVSIIGCLEDLLAHGHDIDVIGDLLEGISQPPDSDDDDGAQASISDFKATPLKVTKLRESLAAATILENSGRRDDKAEVTLTTYAIEWKDDCDYNNVKQNQGGIFVSSFTFASLPALRNSLSHTYIVAVGPQHVSHECVEQRMADDLRILAGREPGIPAPRFYSKKHGGIVVPHLEIISSLADQPMRRFMNGLIAGNGTYGARFGLSIDLASVLDEIVPCDSCLSRMLEGEEPSTTCSQCTNWNMTHERIRMKAPANYPQDELGADGMISPIVLTYDKLKSWVHKAHTKYVSTEWTDKATVAFLTAHALSTQAIKEIVQHAEAELVYNRQVLWLCVSLCAPSCFVVRACCCLRPSLDR